MIVKDSTIEALRKQFVKLFQKGLGSAPQEWKRLATRIPSGGAENTYGWLGKFPQMREWVGDRVLKSMAEHAYSLANKKFESTVDVDRADIEDDNLGIYSPIVESVGEEAMNHIDRNIYALLTGGFSALCYDGQNFFDTDHPVNAEVDGSGADTPTANILNPATTTEPAWFLLHTKKPVKPLIFQERTKAEFETITDPKQDTVFMKDKYLYGVRARRAFGYGFWQMAVAARDTLNEANFNAAMQMMMEFQADGGDPLNLTPDLLVVPPSLRAVANELILAQYKADGASNPNYKAVDVLVTSWLA